jgi:cytochrome P450
MPTDRPVDYDPFSPAVRDDPYPYYARLRDEAPVYFAEASSVWCVTRYEDVRFVLRNPALFSSDAMRTMLIGARPGLDRAGDPQMMQRLAAIANVLPFSLQELMSARNLISEDPPRHGVLRATVNRGFTPRRIAAWETRMREIVSACIAPLRDGVAFDVVEDLAIPLPVRIIAEMLGVEPERIDDFKRWSDRLVATTTGSQRGQDPVTSGLVETIGELSGYIATIAERRRRAPGDDLVSVLVAAQDGDAGLTNAEVAFLVQLLLVAGNETTTNLIGNATHALLRHPEELARVASDPGLVPSLVEETLRWDSPVQFVFRRSTQPVEIAGTTIPSNAHVSATLGSANRDERQWGPSAARFDVSRDPQSHLSFGLGNHFCLGASLARLEARVALEALVPELPRLARVESDVVYVDSFLVRGPRHLALRRAA